MPETDPPHRLRGHLGRARPTLEKVALLAGVSRATVSRVVNGAANVSEPVRTAVLRAVDELGYVPNPAARSLVTQRSDLVALIISERESTVFTDPFFGAVMRGVALELERVDKQLLLLMTAAGADHSRIERYIAGGHADGVMLMSTHGGDALPATLVRTGVPVVQLGRPMSAPPPPYVEIDNAGGARSAVRHLLDLGRQRIATIAGPQDMGAGIDRLAAYRTQMQGSDRRSLVAVGDFTLHSGEQAMRQLLADDPHLDAVFAASDLMAEGALRTLRRAGRRVPDDVAVVGFDDNDRAGYTDPPLTTVRQPCLETGRHLVRLLLSVTAGEPTPPPVLMPTELVVRESA